MPKARGGRSKNARVDRAAAATAHKQEVNKWANKVIGTKTVVAAREPAPSTLKRGRQLLDRYRQRARSNGDGTADDR